MPRRRALRLLATTLAVAAVPGVRPLMAREAPLSRAASCGDDKRCCPRLENVGTGPDWPCGPPARRYGCGDARLEPDVCNDLCPPPGVPCSSAKKASDGFTAFTCCPKNTRCCITDKGEEATCCGDNQTCLKTATTLIGCCPNSRVCRDKCCLPGQVCKNGRCGSCPPREEPCSPADGGSSKCCCSGGRARCGTKCCPKNSRCADPGKGRCEKCPTGAEECGSTCCKRGTYCCNSSTGTCCSDKNGSCCGDSPICCENRDCCQVARSRFPYCCPSGETCGDAGSSSGVIVGRPYQICCTADRVVRLSGATICCPYGTVSLGGKVVVNTGLCCAKSRVCGSGPSITCCGPNTTCQAGRCVF